MMVAVVMGRLEAEKLPLQLCNFSKDNRGTK